MENLCHTGPLIRASQNVCMPYIPEQKRGLPDSRAGVDLGRVLTTQVARRRCKQ